jgi:hypothetical protein
MNLGKIDQTEEFQALKRAATDDAYMIPNHMNDTALVVSFALELISDRKSRYWEDWKLVRKISEKYPEVTKTKIRHYLQLAKMLTVYLNPLNVELEKIRLIHSIKDNAQKAALANTAKDRDVMAKEHNNLTKILGLDKPIVSGSESSVIVNIFNFDPSLIGAQKRPNLLGQIAQELKKIEKDQEEQLADFETLKGDLEDDLN